MMEALIVVAIIGISAAIAAPALSLAMADRRASEATHSLVRLGARARSEAMAYGRAHLLVYSQTSGGSSADNGSVELWRGQSNLCNGNPWPAVMADPNARVETLDMGNYDYGTHQVRMRVANPAAAVLCFEPNGDVLFSSVVGAFRSPAFGIDPDGVRFTFDRLMGGSVDGVQRVVVFPFGATPRIDR